MYLRCAQKVICSTSEHIFLKLKIDAYKRTANKLDENSKGNFLESDKIEKNQKRKKCYYFKTT